MEILTFVRMTHGDSHTERCHTRANGRKAVLPQVPSWRTSQGHEAFQGLPGHLGDDFEVLVDVEDDQPVGLSRRGEEQVGKGHCLVLAVFGEEQLYFHRTVFRGEGEVLDGH